MKVPTLRVVVAFLALVTAAAGVGVGVSGNDIDSAYVYSLEEEDNDNTLIPEPEPKPEPGIGVATTATPLDMDPPDIHFLHIHSDIRYRYSTTKVTCRATNHYRFLSKEISFQIVLPNSAYISKFIMDIDGKSYEAYVKEKEEARSIYNQARSQGRTSGIVEVSARDSNVFNLNINLKPSSNVTFNLTYEEFLVRKLGRYEQIIHVSPEQISKIPDYKVTVTIHESQNLTFLRVPVPKNQTDLKSMMLEFDDEQTGIDKPMEESDTRNILISSPGPNAAVIEWRPTQFELRTLADGDGSKGQEANTQFLVQYDVARSNSGGEILLMNGYFVHFFAPRDLLPLRKHVIFVLDVSGSMSGRRIEQLKNAMKFILDDLKPDDYFNIITFSSGVQGWNPSTTSTMELSPYTYSWESKSYRTPILASEDNLVKGHRFIESLIAMGATDINAALIEALALASTVTATLPPNVEPVVLFLTDGEPTVGVTAIDLIFANVRKANTLSIPVYSLAFGTGADFEFIKKLALQNFGFGRKIYEAADADLQLKGFYKEISSPMLSNATFRYTTNGSSIGQLTQVKFSKVFQGTEVVVAGKFGRDKQSGSLSTPIVVDIDGSGRDGLVSFGIGDVAELDLDGGDERFVYSVDDPSTEAPMSTTVGRGADVANDSANIDSLERLWAYLTIKQLLEKDLQGTAGDDTSSSNEEDGSDENALIPTLTNANTASSVPKETPKERALRLSLKYGFVTPLTSLVVVKPNDTETTNTLTEAPAPTAQSDSGSNANQHTARTTTTSPGYRSIRYGGWSSQPQTTHAPERWGYGSGGAPRTFGGSRDLMMMSDDDSDEVDYYTNYAPRLDNFQTHRSRQSHSPVFSSWPLRSTTTTTTTTRRPTPSISTTTTTTTPQPTTKTTTLTSISSLDSSSIPSRRLSLDDVSWLPNVMNNYSPLWINGTRYFVASGRTKIRGTPTECIVNTRNATTTGQGSAAVTRGVCQHLKDCVLPDFVNDVKVYYDSYFCPIRRSARSAYAGVCCLNRSPSTAAGGR